MKGKFLVLGLTMLLLLGLSIGNALAASSVTYLGKTTWTATVTASTQGGTGATHTITGGISKVGDEFYLFQGYVVDQGNDGPFIIGGPGVLIGNTLYFTLSESQRHADGWRDGGVMNIEIDKTTQNGTFYDIGHDYNTASPGFDQRYTAGDLILAGSPIPFGATTAPQKLLLLD